MTVNLTQKNQLQLDTHYADENKNYSHSDSDQLKKSEHTKQHSWVFTENIKLKTVWRTSAGGKIRWLRRGHYQCKQCGKVAYGEAVDNV